MRITGHEIERVRAPNPEGVLWPWEPDVDVRPAEAVETLRVDEAASIARAREAGRNRVLAEDVVHRIETIEVRPPGYEGPRSGMLLVVDVDELPAGFSTGRLERALWREGVAVSAVVLDETTIRLASPASEIDVDRALELLEAISWPDDPDDGLDDEQEA